MSAAIALTPVQRILLIAASVTGPNGCNFGPLFAVVGIAFPGIADERALSELRALAGLSLVALGSDNAGRDFVKLTPAGVRLADAMLPALPAAQAKLGAS